MATKIGPSPQELPNHWIMHKELPGRNLCYFDPDADVFHIVDKKNNTVHISGKSMSDLGFNRFEMSADMRRGLIQTHHKNILQAPPEPFVEPGFHWIDPAHPVIAEPEPEKDKVMTQPTRSTDALSKATEALADVLLNEDLIKRIEDKAEDVLNSYRKSKVTITSKVKKPTVTLEESTHKAFPNLLKSVTCGNVALVGPTGCGKTTIASQVATALGLDFYMNGALQSEYKLTGFVDAKGGYVRTPFRDAFEKGGVYLFDEIDASSANVLLQFNAALSNGYSDFPDGMVKKHDDFYCIAAANTYWTGRDREYVGRNQLDAATMDRFIFMEMDYDEALERALCSNAEWVDHILKIRKAINKLKLRHIVSPRASFMGAEMLSNGVSRRVVEDALVWKSLDSTSKQKIKKAVDEL